MGIPRSVARAAVPLMLPLGCRWIEAQERRILAEGRPLDPAQLADARALGLAEPQRIRILPVPRLPLPSNRFLRQVGLWTGTLSGESVGMCARYGIYIRSAYQDDRRLLAHELTHTRQYERVGGIRPFLRRYIEQCLTDGYLFAALECEARDASEALCD